MKRNSTVKKRIFWTNTRMVLTTLSIFLIINVIFLKLYFHLIEEQMILTAGQTISAGVLEDIVEDLTIHNNDFIVLFFIDGIICIFVLIIISQFFTKNLTTHIMKPLQILTDATQRIKNNDFSYTAKYTGEKEFEDICNTFNEMQYHLVKAQERNKEYEKARTDMIIGISHDLRTPLTAIKGAVKGILDGIAVKSEQQEKLLEVAYRRSEDMEILLKQLFYLSKLKTGNMPILLKKVNILEYLQTYISTKQLILDSEKETIYMQKNNISEYSLIDIEQFRRILDNLLENSRKYANTIPLKIEITINKFNDNLEICFSDNGVGVSQEKIPFIFDEFYRGDESRNSKEGNGLGLYIVKSLMEMMGGHVRAKSSNGFQVYLTLPIVQKGKIGNE